MTAGATAFVAQVHLVGERSKTWDNYLDMCARPRKSDDEARARQLRDALGELRPFIDQCKTAIVESARAAGHENPVLSKVPARARASPRVPLPLRGKTLDGARCSRAPLRSQDLLALVGAGEMQTPHIDLAPGQLQAIMAITDNAAPTLVYAGGDAAPTVKEAFAMLEMSDSSESRYAKVLRFAVRTPQTHSD